MIDRLFLATFTFCLLVGGTLAIGSEWLVMGHAQAVARSTPEQVRVIQLERVVIVGKRLVPDATVARTVSAETSTQRAQ